MSKIKEKFSLLSWVFRTPNLALPGVTYMLSVGYSSIEGTHLSFKNTLVSLEMSSLGASSCTQGKGSLAPTWHLHKKPKKQWCHLYQLLFFTKHLDRYTTFNNSILFMIVPWSMRNQHAFQLCDVQSGRFWWQGRNSQPRKILSS